MSLKSVTNVGAAASVILTPGPYVRTVSIQNNGSGPVSLSFDGSTVPTASLGYLLGAGSQLILTYTPGGGAVPPPANIQAILTTATTTTLLIATDDLVSA